jgi:hypothetical protein
MPLQIERSKTPVEVERQALLRSLAAYNLFKASDSMYEAHCLVGA